jgi:short-subunit dehydrogenase
MGRAVARQLAGRGDSLCLLGRDLASLERSAADLEARGTGGRVASLQCDLFEPDSFRPQIEAAAQVLGGLDLVVMSAGVFGTQEQLEADPELRRAVLLGNFTHTIEFCEAARTQLLAQGGGTLCVFSSVAGERGRKPVGFYGATKAGLSRYLEALDHRFHNEGLRVVTVKPGFVHTSMTAALPPAPFAGEPDAVAARVVRAIDRGTPIVYAPAIWALVMLVIRNLPRFIMRRVGF